MSDWNDYQHVTESGVKITVKPHPTEEFGTPEVTIRQRLLAVTMPLDELDAFVMIHRKRMLEEIKKTTAVIASKSVTDVRLPKSGEAVISHYAVVPCCNVKIQTDGKRGMFRCPSCDREVMVME